MTYPPGRSGQSWPDVTSLAGYRPALAWLAARWSRSFSAICFLESSGSGGLTASAIPLP
jgi:hypothetical protein